MKATVIGLVVATTMLYVFAGWVLDDKLREIQSRERMEAQFFSTDSLTRANHAKWLTEEKWEDDEFKRDTRRRLDALERRTAQHSEQNLWQALPGTDKLLDFGAIGVVLAISLTWNFFQWKASREDKKDSREDKKEIMSIVSNNSAVIAGFKEFISQRIK